MRQIVQLVNDVRVDLLSVAKVLSSVDRDPDRDGDDQEDAGQLDEGGRLVRKVLVRRRIGPGANVEGERFLSGQRISGEVGHDGGERYPLAEKVGPEPVLDCDRVLDPKDEDVAGDEDEVVVKNDHRLDGSFEDELKMTKLAAERSSQVT